MDDGNEGSLKVGDNCPYRKYDYTRAQVIRKDNKIAQIEGPRSEIFTKQKESLYEILGAYTCKYISDPDKRPDDHYIRISLSETEFTFTWKTRANEIWDLNDYGDKMNLAVTDTCSYYHTDNYTKMEIVREKVGGHDMVKGVLGPKDMFYEKEEHLKCNVI